MGYNPKGYNPIFSTRLNFSLQMIYTFEFLIFKFNPFPTQRVATRAGLQPKLFNRVNTLRVVTLNFNRVK
jgi:hypothetical protein